MIEIFSFLRNITSQAIDLILLPFLQLSPIVGLTVVSALCGVVLLLLYGKVSSQKKIKETKKRIMTALQELVLFRHDVVLCLRAQGRMLGLAFKYLALAVPPLVILAVPCIFILSELYARYGIRSFHPGEHGIVKVQLTRAELLDQVQLETTPGLEVTPAVRVAEPPELIWRLNVNKNDKVPSGKVMLRIGEDKTTIEQQILTDSNARITPEWTRNWLNEILYPTQTLSENTANFIKQISFSYPERELLLFGQQVNWILYFFVVSLVAGLAASRFFKIEI